MALDIVIMAAGKGTRMKSARPKVLHRLAGRSLLQHVVDTAATLKADRTVAITGHGAAQVEAAFAGAGLAFVRQEPQLGTGHAVQQAVPQLHDEGTTLILNGDVPLIEADTLAKLVHACGGKSLALLTVVLDDPSGYGRIVRSGDSVGGLVEAIVEHKDANEAQRRIREVYTGVMAAPTALLTVELADPGGYGRIVRRADGGVQAIVEQKDASEAQRSI
ncbi:MAG: NTP transferase domain-containing protein, partial [Proteobacteria bacterium]|nr:NTP transferase domain-containing protein [Pseudomonadota bacterium]